MQLNFKKQVYNAIIHNSKKIHGENYGKTKL